MSQPPPITAEIEPTPEKIILEFELSQTQPQSDQDLTAHATLQRCTRAELLARLLQKKLGGLFTVRAA